jgi:hypothetical protein
VSGARITAREQSRILALLDTLPLPQVRERTGRPYLTLAKIAAAQEKPA